jgi:predicted permease
MDTLLQDLRHTLRSLRRTPVFTAAAALTLALGLGVNVAVFTMMNAALLASLPVREPDRLVQVATLTEQGGDHFDFSYPLYSDLRDNSRAFSGLAAYSAVPVGVSSSRRSDRVMAEFVTANYFTVLGVDPAAGPGFAGRDELRGSDPTAVISQRLWRTLFENDSAVIGKSASVNGKSFTIVGVAPQRFDGIIRGQRTDIWMTVAQFFRVRNRPDGLDRREMSWLTIVGRLAPGVSASEAAAELTTFGRSLNVMNAGPGWTARVRPAGMGDTGLVESLTRPLGLLMLVVGLIMVVASANVANLLLARAHGRQPEIAMRQALGASRGRIVQQLLTEGAVLAAAGGALGLLLASWLVALFEVRTSGGALLTLALDPDTTVIGFAIALSAVAALGSGLIPALSRSRPDLLMDHGAAILASGESRWPGVHDRGPDV